MSCGIYKITNLINQKVYIGQSINIEKRWNKHKTANDDFAIHRALKKYGINNFSFDIIELCDKDLLDEREIYWINTYNSLIPNGYNMVEGGSNGSGFAKGKEVYQFDLDGNFIAKYKSANQASEITGIEHTAICACCRYKRNTAGNYQWRYSSNINNKKSIKSVAAPIIQMPIVQYDLKGNKITTYKSLAEAARITGINKSGICNVCKQKTQTAGGFRWAYIGQPLVIKERKKMPTRKPIQQFDKEGNLIQQFNSLTEAGQITGINPANIGQVCNNKRKTAGGFIWRYI